MRKSLSFSYACRHSGELTSSVFVRLCALLAATILASTAALAQQERLWIVLDKDVAGEAEQAITGQPLAPGEPLFELMPLDDPTLAAQPPITDENLRVARIHGSVINDLQGILHGPRFKKCGGFTVHNSRSAALLEPRNPFYTKQYLQRPLKFVHAVEQHELVGQALDKVQPKKIVSTIEELTKFGTRDHNKPGGQKAAMLIADTWGKLGAGRRDFTVKLRSHKGWLQDSVVATIMGTEHPDEFVIIGAHLDSINRSNQDDAPGADDDASGVAVVTEVLRILTELDFKPKRSLEFIAYAAEEYGLLGSDEIAKEYFDNIKKGTNGIKDVVAVLQMDMTGWVGPGRHIYFVDDFVSTDLTDYLKRLINEYNGPGGHEITYGNTRCGYACSDSGSWTKYGFPAAFPFEATFEKFNPHIHSPNDKLANLDTTGAHQSRFAKLGLEFVIEVANAAAASEASEH